MKGIIIAALALMVGASFNTADAASKKKKDKKAAPAPVEVKLQTMTDSLSYAAGTVRTNGLIPYLTQQLGVDTAYIADFISGYEQAMQKGMGKKEQAYYAGEQIAVMVSNRMLPMLKDEFKGYADTVNTAAFNKGFVNSLRNDTTVMTAKQAQEYFEKAYKAATDLRNAATRKAGEDFLKENALKEGVKTTPSGLQYKVITQGTGEVAGENDEVTVKYEGRLIDGTVFDSSYKRPGETAKFRPNQVIKGWTEALTMMPAGSKWELYIPQELAYGERQAGKIPACSALIFTVETVSVDKPKPAAEAATPEAKADATKAAPAKKAPAAKKKK